MDIKAQVEKIAGEIKKDPGMLAQFKSDPVPVVEKLLGVDLPDEIVKKVIDGVKAAMVSDKLAGAADAVKKLF